MHVVQYFKNTFLISEHQGMIRAKNNANPSKSCHTEGLGLILDNEELKETLAFFQY